MKNRQRARLGLMRLAGLIIALGLAGCAGPPPLPPLSAAQVEPRAGTPDPACVAKCERHFKEAVRVCDDLYSSPDSGRYQDAAWRQQCLDQARMQYEGCLTYGGR